LDLITPARTWAPRETAEKDVQPDVEAPMPKLQQVVMFFSVVGPIAGLVAAIVLLWKKNGAWGMGWPQLVCMGAMYAICGFGVTIGFHRLFTHKAFETRRWLRLLLAICGSAAGQGMFIRWCATHRRHHQQADREGDPHSPHMHGGGVKGLLLGLYHAHVGWCFDADRPDLARSISDLQADKTLLLIDQLYFLWVGLGILAPGIGLGIWLHSWNGFFSGMIWGGLARICLMQHATWSINSVCHVWGTRPFRNIDHSTNNFPIAILSLGEGWHNNHHAFPTSARHGLRWWEFDASYVLICVLKSVGLAWDVRLPAPTAIAARQKNATAEEL